VGCGVEVVDQLVIDAAQHPLLVAVAVLPSAFLFAGHGLKCVRWLATGQRGAQLWWQATMF
jgi:hypothetical protein